MQSLTTVTIEVQTTYAIGDRHTGMKGDGHRIGMGIISIPMQADGHAGSAIKVLVAIHYSVLDARNGYIRNVVV